MLTLTAANGAKNSDTGWHILLGHDVVTGVATPLTYGPHRHWVNTETLFEIASYLAYRAIGITSVPGWSAIMVVASILAAVTAASWIMPVRRRAAGLLAGLLATILLLPTAAESDWLAARPVGFSVAASFLLGAVLYRAYRTGHAPHPLLAFLAIAAWTNLHGGSLLAAPLLLGMLILNRIITRVGLLPVSPTRTTARQSALTVAAMAAGTLATPIGIGIYPAAAAIRETCMGMFYEWATPGTHTLQLTGMLLLAWVGLTIAARIPRRIALTDAVFVVALLVVNAATNRTMFTALAAASIVLARPIARIVGRWNPGSISPALATAFAASTLVGAASATVTATPVLFGNAPIIAGLANTTDTRRVVMPIMENGLTQFATGPNVTTYMDGRLDRYGRDGLLEEAKRHHDTAADLTAGMSGPLSAGTTDVVTDNPSLAKYLTARGWRTACTSGQHTWFTTLPTGECATTDLSAKIAHTIPRLDRP